MFLTAMERLHGRLGGAMVVVISVATAGCAAPAGPAGGRQSTLFRSQSPEEIPPGPATGPSTYPHRPGSLAPGGLLAMPTNMGRYQSSQISVLPELTVRFRRPLSRFFTITCGYTALVLNNVVRTGDQIDLAVNPTQFGAAFASFMS